MIWTCSYCKRALELDDLSEEQARTHVDECRQREFARRDALGPPPHTDYYHQSDDEHVQARSALDALLTARREVDT